MPYRLHIHCGIEWLGYVNDIARRADVSDGVVDFIPPEWEPLVDEGSIVLSILLSTDPEPTIEATANGHTIVYRPTAQEPPGCD